MLIRLHVVYGCLHTSTAELSHCSKDHVAHKTEKNYSLNLYSESLASPALTKKSLQFRGWTNEVICSLFTQMTKLHAFPCLLTVQNKSMDMTVYIYTHTYIHTEILMREQLMAYPSKKDWVRSSLDSHHRWLFLGRDLIAAVNLNVPIRSTHECWAVVRKESKPWLTSSETCWPEKRIVECCQLLK